MPLSTKDMSQWIEDGRKFITNDNTNYYGLKKCFFKLGVPVNLGKTIIHVPLLYYLCESKHVSSSTQIAV